MDAQERRAADHYDVFFFTPAFSALPPFMAVVCPENGALQFTTVFLLSRSVMAVCRGRMDAQERRAADHYDVFFFHSCILGAPAVRAAPIPRAYGCGLCFYKVKLCVVQTQRGYPSRLARMPQERRVIYKSIMKKLTSN